MGVVSSWVAVLASRTGGAGLLVFYEGTNRALRRIDRTFRAVIVCEVYTT